MAPLEIRHRSVRPISAKHAQASRFLQQSPFGRGRLPTWVVRMKSVLVFMMISELLNWAEVRSGA
jgi:hypothetical protein